LFFGFLNFWKEKQNIFMIFWIFIFSNILKIKSDVKIFLYMWPIKKKVPNQRHVCKFAELDGGGGYSGKKIFTRMQIKPKFLQG